MAHNTILSTNLGVGDEVTDYDLVTGGAYPTTGKVAQVGLYLSTAAGQVPTPVYRGQVSMANSVPVVFANNQSALPVTGTFWQTTQPVSLASVPSHDVTNAGTFSVQVTSLPSGLATSAKQDTGNTSLSSIDSKVPALGQALAAASVPIVLTAAQITTLTPPAAITGFATEATLSTLNGKVTACNTGAVTISAALPAGTNAIGKLSANSGVDIGDVDVTSVPTDPFGVNADAASATGSISAKLRFIAATGIPVTGTVAVTQSGTWNVATITTVTTVSTVTNLSQMGGVAITLNKGASDTGTQRVTLGDGTQTIGALTANQSVNLAQVGGSSTATGHGTASGVLRVELPTDGTGIIAGVTTVTTLTTCSTLTALTGGGVAHDGADSGNPVKVGARAAATLSDDTMVANGDRTDAVSDLDAVLITRPQFPLGDLISERVSNTDGASTAFSNFGAVASTRSVITAIVVVNTSASNGYVDFRDGTAGSVLFTVPIPANGGVVLPAGATPYFKTTANTALAFDVSAALSTVYISVSGFKSKVT